MNYMEDLFKVQKEMYDSFKDMYSFNRDDSDKEEAGTYARGMEGFFDMQKKAFDYWGDQANPFSMYGKNMNPSYFNTDILKNMAKMQKDYFQAMNDLYKNQSGSNLGEFYNFNNFNEVFNKYREFYSGYDFSQIFNSNVFDSMEKMYDVNKFYLEMYNFWDRLNQDFVKASNFDSDKLRDFVRENSDMAYNMVLELIPEQFKLYLQEPKELLDKYFESLSQFYSPWTEDFNQLKDLYVKGILGNDVEKITDFFQLWKNNYDQSFGKIISSPALGSNRNVTEQQNKAFNRFIDMFTISSEFASKLMSTQRTAFKNIIDQYVNLSKDGLEAKTFEEFYNFWSKEMDGYLVDYFASEEFSKMLGEFGKSIMEFQIETNKLVEGYLEATPIVTKGELDGIFKSVYDLKKEVRSLKKELSEVKANQDTEEKAKETKTSKTGKTTKETKSSKEDKK